MGDALIWLGTAVFNAVVCYVVALVLKRLSKRPPRRPPPSKLVTKETSKLQDGSSAG